jgi:hypothetical protein
VRIGGIGIRTGDSVIVTRYCGYKDKTGTVTEKYDGGSLIRVKFNTHESETFFPWDLRVIPGGMGCMRPMALPIIGQEQPLEKVVEQMNKLLVNFVDKYNGKIQWVRGNNDPVCGRFEVRKPHHRAFWVTVGKEEISSTIQGDDFAIGCQKFNTESARRALIRLVKDNEHSVMMDANEIVATREGINYNGRLLTWAQAEFVLKELDVYVLKESKG